MAQVYQFPPMDYEKLAAEQPTSPVIPWGGNAIDYMLRILTDPYADLGRKDWAAKLLLLTPQSKIDAAWARMEDCG